MYQIYTFPACEKCHKAVELFKEKNISYEEIKAASSEGRNRAREFSKKYKDRIRREDGWLVLPLIVRQDGEVNGEIKIYQGEEELEKFLKENENI